MIPPMNIGQAASVGLIGRNLRICARLLDSDFQTGKVDRSSRQPGQERFEIFHESDQISLIFTAIDAVLTFHFENQVKAAQLVLH
jgi:hypothetical protein